MTFNEAIGIKYANVDLKSGEEISHEEKYGRMIDFLGGLDVVWQYVPFDLETICEAIQNDRWLNNTSMREWDSASGFLCIRGDCKPLFCGVWELYRKHGITSASNAAGVCLLKEAARRMAARNGVFPR